MAKHVKIDERKALIQEFEQSSLSRGDFCASHGLNPKSLNRWLALHNGLNDDNQATLTAMSQESFIPLVVSSSDEEDVKRSSPITPHKSVIESTPAQSSSSSLREEDVCQSLILYKNASKGLCLEIPWNMSSSSSSDENVKTLKMVMTLLHDASYEGCFSS